MISYQEALEIIQSNCEPATIEQVDLLSSLGRVSAAQLISKMEVPSFLNSAMDGFAVRTSDIALASDSNKVKIKIIATIGAGENVITTEPGVVQIMTGAPVPNDYDAVIPIEEVELDGQCAVFRSAARENENIRFSGEDVARGQVVLERGKQISAEDIMLLAAVGIDSVSVYKIPKLEIISTGNEIIDDYKIQLPQGKIYNSNAPYLMAQAKRHNLHATYSGLIEDDKLKFEKILSNVQPDTIIISTGAVSKGKWDFIPKSLQRIGAKIHFHRVNIRPGKPVLFASLSNGSYFFGLPGNPVSTAIGFRFFVMPLLRRMQGLTDEKYLVAKLKDNFTKKQNFRQFLKSNLEIDKTGQMWVSISDGQESFKISPMVKNNAWTILEENKTEFAAGDLVKVLPINSWLS